MKARVLIFAMSIILLLIGCTNNADDSNNSATRNEKPQENQTVKQTQETKKQEPGKSKVNENCMMKGADFIQKSREERRSIIISCRDGGYARGSELWDIEGALSVANRYFTNSEAWESPIMKFLDDYLDGNINTYE